MARRNGQAGRSGILIGLAGLAILAVGLFIGAELNGLNVLGYVMVLAGFLTALFGVLREVSDRTHS